MSTASFDCTIKLWNVEEMFDNDSESVRIKSDVTSGSTVISPLGEFTSHSNSIRTCSFHPVIPHLLCSTAQDYTLRFFDANALKEVSCYRLAANNASFGANMDHAIVSNVSFNYEGNVMALACKDRFVRLFDARQQQMIGTTSGVSPIGRNLRVAWCARSAQQDPLVTVCAGSQGLRQINLWDPRKMSQALSVRTIDNGSGQLFPMFDEGLNVVFVAGKGDTIVRSYELANLDETTAASSSTSAGTSAAASTELKELKYLFEKCSDFQSSKDPIAGICMLPKRVCDVRSVEVSRLLKLTSESVVPLHFRVPRAEHLKDFFHDDIFLPVRSKHSELTVTDWLEAPITGSDGFGLTSNPLFTPIVEFLKPVDMMNISEKPVEPTPSAVNSKVETFKNKMAKEKEEEQKRESQFAKLQQMAIQNAQYNRNRSGPVKIGGVVVNAQVAEDSDSDNDWDS
jgi:coronin-7